MINYLILRKAQLKFYTYELLNTASTANVSQRMALGCVRCKTEEASGIASKRQLDCERWTDAFDNYTEDSI